MQAMTSRIEQLQMGEFQGSITVEMEIVRELISLSFAVILIAGP